MHDRVGLTGELRHGRCLYRKPALVDKVVWGQPAARAPERGKDQNLRCIPCIDGTVTVHVGSLELSGVKHAGGADADRRCVEQHR